MRMGRNRMVGIVAISVVVAIGLGWWWSQRDQFPTDSVSHEKYDRVSPIGWTGDTTPAEVTAARINSKGTLQVFVSGSYCQDLASLSISESPDRVKVNPSLVLTSDGPCEAAIVPWIVDVELEAPLANRSLIAGGVPVEVATCSLESREPICQFGSTSAR